MADDLLVTDETLEDPLVLKRLLSDIIERLSNTVLEVADPIETTRIIKIINTSSLPNGGILGDLLTKDSNKNQDASWQTPSSNEGGSVQQSEHYKTSWPQFYNFSNIADHPILTNRDTGFVALTFNTVTKTGGGGDVIWPALDGTPDTAKAIIVRLWIQNQSNGSDQNVMYCRPIGETEGPGSHNTYVRIDHFANNIEMEAGWAVIPYAGAAGFECRFDKVIWGSTQAPRIHASYRGFME